MFRNIAGSINSNSDTSASFEVVDNFVNDSETLLVNVSGAPPTVATATDYPVNVAGEYPVVYWRLNEPAATGSAFDSNQNLFAIYPRLASSSLTTVTQGTASFLPHSNSTDFSATTSQITFPNNSSVQITTDLSAEFWVNFISLGTAGTTSSILGKGVTGAGGTGEFEVYVTNNAGTGQILFLQNNTAAHITGGSLTIGAWYHVMVVRNATAATTTVYVNGVSVASGAYVAASTTTGTVNLGAAGTSPSPTMLLAEVALYRKPLSAAQVANHYAWGTATDALARVYSGTATFYSLLAYPAYGTPTPAAYSNASTTWGSFSWQ